MLNIKYDNTEESMKTKYLMKNKKIGKRPDLINKPLTEESMKIIRTPAVIKIIVNNLTRRKTNGKAVMKIGGQAETMKNGKIKQIKKKTNVSLRALFLEVKKEKVN